MLHAPASDHHPIPDLPAPKYPSGVEAYGLYDACAGKDVSPALLEGMLTVFNGNPVPAMYRFTGRRGWRKAPRAPLRLAAKAHLLGEALVGVYPYQGGDLGCDYVCIDLDNHDGQVDINRRLRRLLTVCHSNDIRPMVATSKSSTGAHVFVLSSRNVPTTVAHAAGRALCLAADITDRADIIPSARHPKGVGTQHALPLSPLAEPGGSLLLDSMLRPVLDRDIQARTLWHYHGARHDPTRLEALASACPHKLSDRVAQAISQGVLPNCGERRRLHELQPVEGDDEIIRAVRACHPQFRAALARGSGKWAGGRSMREAVLAAMLARQGVSPIGIAQWLVDLPDSKSAERGLDYAMDVALFAHAPDGGVEIPTDFAGTHGAATSRGLPGWPSDRRAPPRRYRSTPNPWWNPTVQKRLARNRTPTDAIVLAYLIDRWHRGPTLGGEFYMGVRGIAEELELPPTTVQHAVRRLRENFADVLAVTPGVPHPTLRIANAFNLVGAYLQTDAGAVVSHHDGSTSSPEGVGVGDGRSESLPAVDEPGGEGRRPEGDPSLQTDAQRPEPRPLWT